MSVPRLVMPPVPVPLNMQPHPPPYPAPHLKRPEASLRLRPRPPPHPAAAAELDAFQCKVQEQSARRRAHLAMLEQRAASNRQKEHSIGTFFVRSRIKAHQTATRDADREADQCRFNDVSEITPRIQQAAAKMARIADSGPVYLGVEPTSARSAPEPIARLPSIYPSGTVPQKQPRASLRSDKGAYQLTSAQTVRAVIDLLRATATSHAAMSRGKLDHSKSPPLFEIAQQHMNAVSAGKAFGLAEPAIFACGLLGIRIGCAECDPHPLVRLFQLLSGWLHGPELSSKSSHAVYLLIDWFLPSAGQQAKGIRQKKLHGKAGKRPRPRIGAAPEYEPMVPRTCVNFDAAGKVLRLLCDRQLLDVPSQSVPFLMRAAESLSESTGKRRVVDAEELILYWAELWRSEGYWRIVDLPRRAKVRVDRQVLQQQQHKATSTHDIVNITRQAAAAELDEQGRRMSHNTFLDQVAPEVHKPEEEFASGMRNNAMEISVADADQDRKLDFDEFVAFIKNREVGPHSMFELRSRFDALDADGSGQIELHELIRFSLRDALRHASGRVMDLLREWDDDGNGSIERSEFQQAIAALGYGALASKEDIDLVFNEFDESGDGVIQFQELDRMLRQSSAADARILGGVKGRVAVETEGKSKLRRHAVNCKDAEPAVGLQAIDAKDGAEMIEQLRSLYAGSPAQIMSLFKQFDVSGDGLITRKEFSLALRAWGLSLHKRELKLLFKQLDPDGSDTIDFHELRGLLC